MVSFWGKQKALIHGTTRDPIGQHVGMTAPDPIIASQAVKMSSTAKLALPSVIVTVAQAAATQANRNIASFAIKDTAANVFAGLSSLLADSKLVSIILTDSATPRWSLTGAAYAADLAVLNKITSSYSLVVSGATVAQAAGLQANAHVTSFTLLDSGTHVASGLNGLLPDSKLTSIMLTDKTAPTLSITGAAYAADVSVLAKIASPYYLSVTGATVASAAGLQANSHVTSFAISDTAAHIQAALNSLNSMSQLTSIRVSDGLPVTMSYAQYRADTAVRKELGSAYINVAGVTAGAAMSVWSDPHVLQETIADKLSNVGANLDALESLAQIGGITNIAVTDVGQSLTLSPTQYAADFDAIRLMTGNFTINQSSPTPTPAPTPSPSGFHLNIVYDSSMSAAPTAFKSALTTAASMLQSVITDNITVNIAVGWGEIGGFTGGTSSAVPSGSAEGMLWNDVYQSYGTVVSELQKFATSTADISVLANLPATSPFGSVSYDIARAQAKAFGVVSATDAGIDGAIGVATDWPSTDYVAVLLHEITHAMGRNSGWSAYGEYDLLDLERFSAPGVFVGDGSKATSTTMQYYSVDGGKTVLADYATSSDFGDWATNSLTMNDPMNAYLASNANALTSVDIKQLDTMGFTITPTLRT